MKTTQLHLTKTWRICVLAVLLGMVSYPSYAQLDMDKFAAMKARNIGPAGMSGRVTAIDAVIDNPDIVYIGTASGGVWKSTNGGINFEPIFDDQPVHSIGAVAIYQNNPDIIYVGSGEGNPRNSHNSGNGMYKSIDGGRTWTHLGLDETRNIHRVIIHPNNPDVVYIGVQGTAWADSPERGVYKSMDGGMTWDKILYTNEMTGIADLVMDPSNPEKLMAAMWEFRRLPWHFTSGGPGSGLHVTFDGGKTWQQRSSDDGLPAGDLGRIGLGIAPSNPSMVYALVEAKKNALYLSRDGGFSFEKVNDSRTVSNRPFYYNDIFVDPVNENRIYHVASRVQVSDDGGKTFEQIMDDVHPDHHAWWIDPNNPNLIYEGNDGGMAISRDRGATWRFPENLPLAQFYHIRVDNSMPYRVCGGLQDNGSWCGPSKVWRRGGIRNSYWEEVAFGDGFDVMIHPDNADIGYAMSQGGNLRRFELVTGYQKNIKPIHPDGETLRFNWNAAIAQDPTDGNTIYYGSQFVHKSTDMGDTWTIISPDLTTNDPEKQKQLDSGGLTYDVTQAENFTSIVAIEPSPIDPSVIWAGTDDGNLQITQDGGATWDNVIDNVRGVPEGTWIPQIRASKHTAGEAFIVFEDHRRSNWEPYLYRTRDFGRSWERLADSENTWGYVLSVEQDPIAPNLLFMGTEFGLYVSVDDGDTWNKFEHGYPTASTMDMALHPRDHDLVLGTFGRSIFVIDDIRPFREIALQGAEMLESPLAAFPAPDAHLAVYRQATGTRFAADGMYAGENLEDGAMITYWIGESQETLAASDGDSESRSSGPSAPADRSGNTDGPTYMNYGASGMDDGPGKKKEEVKIEILNADGDVIRTIKGPAKPGLNRTFWGLRQKGVRFTFSPWGNQGGRNRDAEPAGATVLPGTYTARIAHGDHTAETTINVHMDPRMDVDIADLEARHEKYMLWETHAAVATKAMERLGSAQGTIKTINERLGDRDDDDAKELKKMGREAGKTLKELTEHFTGKQVQGIRRDPNTVMSQIFTARSYITSGMNGPDPSVDIALNNASNRLTEVLDAINTFYAEDWSAYQQAVEDADVQLFDDHEPLSLDSE